jgi:hypothetical protein
MKRTWKAVLAGLCAGPMVVWAEGSTCYSEDAERAATKQSTARQSAYSRELLSVNRELTAPRRTSAVDYLQRPRCR